MQYLTEPPTTDFRCFECQSAIGVHLRKFLRTWSYFPCVLSSGKGKDVAVIFDGTTHVCEVMVIVLRFINDNWKIQQRVVRTMILAKSLTGEEVARQLMSLI